jgi:hypothetical protein
MVGQARRKPMMDRNLAAVARKRLLRKGRALLRLRQDARPLAPGQDLLAGLTDPERGELAEIHAALERIERGIYGRCETCFGDIDGARLEALLWERRCAGCGEGASVGIDPDLLPPAG